MDNATLDDRRIDQARRSLTERLNAIEGKVTESVENVHTAVRETVGTVRDTVGNVRETVQDASGQVRGLVGSAGESMTQALDIRKKIREHPLEGTLVAIGAGLAAWLITRPSSGAKSPLRAALAGTDDKEGPFGEIYSAFRKELVGVGQSAASAAGRYLKEQVETAVHRTSLSH